MDTSTGASSPVIAVADMRAALRQRWWIVLISALLGVAVAAIAIKVLPQTYSAVTTVLVTNTGEEELSSSSSSSTGKTQLVNLDTETQIVTSAAIAERVRTLLHTAKSASDLVADITIDVPPNTTILSITAVADSPTDAQRESRTFAKVYLDQREETAKAAIAAQIKIFESRIADTTKRLQTITGQVAALPTNSPDRPYAEAQQRILVDQITSLSDQLSKLQAITVTPGRVLSDAELPTDPDQPPPVLLLVAGLLFGLVVGVGLALLLARLDRRVRRPADLQALGDVPLLGSIPPGRAGGKGAPLPAIAPSASQIGQAFGQIRNDVSTALPMRPATLLVAGTESGAATSVVAANLAVALARSGAPVLLVCADLAGSTVERMLGLEGLTRADGLAEALSGQGEPLTLLRAAPVVPGLWVLGVGRGRDTAAELLQSRQMEWVLSAVRGDSFVILEAPPTSAGAEAQAMARLCDAAVLVAEVGRSRLDAIDDGAHQLARVGTPLLGVVVAARQSAPKAKRRSGPAGSAGAAQAERPASLAEATVAIRADQLAALRAAEGDSSAKAPSGKAGRAKPQTGGSATGKSAVTGPQDQSGKADRDGEPRATAGRTSRRRPDGSAAEDSNDGLSVADRDEPTVVGALGGSGLDEPTVVGALGGSGLDEPTVVGALGGAGLVGALGGSDLDEPAVADAADAKSTDADVDADSFTAESYLDESYFRPEFGENGYLHESYLDITVNGFGDDSAAEEPTGDDADDTPEPAQGKAVPEPRPGETSVDDSTAARR